MLVIDPPIIPSTSTPIKSLKKQSTIQMALTIDTIWQLRNQQENSNVQLNLLSTIKTLECKIREQIKIFETNAGERVWTAPRWSTPPQGTIKLNADAAMLNQSAALAEVACYSNGDVLKVWTKIVPLNDALMAEAAATLWAVEIAKSEGYQDILVEGDSKICMDALNGSEENWNGKIDNLCFEAKLLCISFVSVCFYWFGREANNLAHSLAKVAASLNSAFVCNQQSLPPSAVEAWMRDVAFIFSS